MQALTSTMKLTPIVFFAFNRPDTTRHILEALSRQSKAIPRLIAFCDGARHEEEHTQVQQVRNLVRAVTWTEVEIIERERNYGLVENIVGGWMMFSAVMSAPSSSKMIFSQRPTSMKAYACS